MIPDSVAHSVEVFSATLGWTHSNTAGDSLFAGIHIRDSTPEVVTGITANGVALQTGPVADIFRARVEGFYWDPAINGPVPTGSIVFAVTFSGICNAYGGSIAFSGANQTTVNDVAGVLATGATNNATVDITTATAGAWVCAFVTTQFGAVLVIGGGDTQNYDLAFTVTNGEVSGSNSAAAVSPAGTKTMNWGIDASENWAIIAFAVRPAAAPGANIVTTSRRIPVPGPRRTQIIMQ